MDTSANTVGNDSDSRAGDSRLRVLVLFGGQSTEHSVSCISAGAVMSHLDPQRYEVIPVGISPDGAWVPQQAELAQLCEQLKAQGAQMPEVEDSGEHVQLVIGGQPGQLRYTTGQRAGEEFA